jgi:hypothetical protein
MASIDRAYVALALVLLIVGEAIGLYMGIANDMRPRAAHIVLVLSGFVVLALFGVTFRLWPAMKAGMAAAIQFWLAVIGTLATAVGAYVHSTTGSIAVVAPAAFVLLAAALLMLWLFWTRSAQA